MPNPSSRAALALFAALIAPSCDGSAPAPTPENAASPAHPVFVSGVVIRLNPLPDRPAAAYFTIKANNPALRLVGVSSPSASRVELHETVTNGNTTSMVPLDAARLDLSRAPVAFEPGGRHAMLFDVGALRAGGDAALVFSFARAGGQTFRVPVTGVVQAAGADMEHMGH